MVKIYFFTHCPVCVQVMYDASGVRLHAGRQAEVADLTANNVVVECRCFVVFTNACYPQVLNQIVFELPAEHPLSESRPLRELLGHTPTQVCCMRITFCFFTCQLTQLPLLCKLNPAVLLQLN